MEMLSIMALLECPLCYEQLDASAKVLPCQHTFCKACLQKQEAAHSQLFCPECRAPIRARTVEELPTNILLVRLLEGLQGSAGPSRNSRYAVPFARSSGPVREGRYRELPGHKEVSVHLYVAILHWRKLGHCLKTWSIKWGNLDEPQLHRD